MLVAVTRCSSYGICQSLQVDNNCEKNNSNNKNNNRNENNSNKLKEDYVFLFFFSFATFPSFSRRSRLLLQKWRTLLAGQMEERRATYITPQYWPKIAYWILFVRKILLLSNHCKCSVIWLSIHLSVGEMDKCQELLTTPWPARNRWNSTGWTWSNSKRRKRQRREVRQQELAEQRMSRSFWVIWLSRSPKIL